MSASERKRELRRRRHRKAKMSVIKRRLTKATSTEKDVIVGKIRRLTPGANTIIENLGLN